MGSVHSSRELGELETQLGLIADWLAQDCTARHADDMAVVVEKAAAVIADLCDEQAELEESAARDAAAPF